MTRETTISGDHALAFGPFRLFPGRRLLLRADKPVPLGSRAREILLTLVEHAGELVRKKELCARVWPNTVVEEGTLRVHIAALRKALRDGRPGTAYVENVSGHGYRFVAPVRRLETEPDATIAAPPRTNNLPALLSRVLGREQAMATLAEQLPQRRFMTLVGPGGIGKTTLAVTTANQLLASYPQGVCFVDLACIRDPSLIAAVVAAALGLAPVPVDPVAGITASLKHKQMLLVLDNCEHLVEAAAQLAESLLDAAPGIHLLATSREPLEAQGEWVLRLAPLDLPPPGATLTAADALAFPAIQLFTDRVMARQASFLLADADVAIVADICRRLDGLPLAMELAAARVELLGLRELAARLDDRLRLLTTGRRTASWRHRTLRATLDWSYELLSPFEQTVLRRLAVFPGVFNVSSACAVAAKPGGDSQDVLEALTSLVGKSLLVVQSSDDRVLYRLLETSRAYALEKLVRTPEAAETRRRHARLCCTWGRLAPDCPQLPTDAWLAANSYKIDDIRAALDWALGPNGDAAVAVRLTAISSPFWFNLCLLNEYQDRLVLALAVLERTGRRAPAMKLQLNTALGHTLLYTRGACPEAQTALHAALEVAERLNIPLYRKRALWGLWVDRLMAADYHQAVVVASHFRRIAGRSGTQTTTALVGERMMALAYHLAGKQNAARRHAERALAWPTQPGTPARDPALPFVRGIVDHRVAAHAALAHILWIQGFPDQAMHASRDSVSHALSINHALSLCYALTCVSGVTLWRGDLPTARQEIDLLLDQASRHALGYWKFWGHCLEFALLRQDGRAGSERRLELLRSPACTPLHVESLGTLTDDPVPESALERAKSGLAGWCAAELLRVSGETLLKGRRTNTTLAQAEALFQSSLELARRQGALSWELRAAMSLARLWKTCGDLPQAYHLLASVQARFTEGFETADLVTASALLADLTPGRRRVACLA